MAKKTKKKMGRPSKGPSVSVTLRLSKELSDRVDRLRKKGLGTRTAALERLVQAGLERENEILGEG